MRIIQRDDIDDIDQTNADDHLMALVLINSTNPRLVYAHLSQEEANALNISQPLSLSRKSGEKVKD